MYSVNSYWVSNLIQWSLFINDILELGELSCKQTCPPFIGHLNINVYNVLGGVSLVWRCL